jgi:hypothetical protein
LGENGENCKTHILRHYKKKVTQKLKPLKYNKHETPDIMSKRKPMDNKRDPLSLSRDPPDL